MRDLSEHDATFDEIPDLRKAAAHPAIFGLGVGVVNGALAKMRDKPVTVRGALATAVVLALGEAVLAWDETTEARDGRPAAWIGVLSGMGVMAGLALFTDWHLWSAGDHPLLIVQSSPPPPQRGSVFDTEAGAPATAVV